MVIAKVVVLKVQAAGYVPSLQVHQDHCRRHKGCCNWKYQYCLHLASQDVKEAYVKAADLARRVGVPCGTVVIG